MQEEDAEAERCYRESQAQRDAFIEEERQRLLQQSASDLVKCLPRGVVQTAEEWEAVKTAAAHVPGHHS